MHTNQNFSELSADLLLRSQKEEWVDSKVIETLQSLNWPVSVNSSSLTKSDFHSVTGVYEPDFLEYYAQYSSILDDSEKLDILRDLKEVCLSVASGETAFEKSFEVLRQIRTQNTKIGRCTLPLINFQDTSKNIFRFQAQAYMPNTNDRADFVLYVNGIPLVAIEDKRIEILDAEKSTQAAEKLGDAKHQLARYAEQLPTLQYGIIYSVSELQIVALPLKNYEASMLPEVKQAIFSVPWKLQFDDIKPTPESLSQYEYHPTNFDFFEKHSAPVHLLDSFRSLAMLLEKSVVLDFLRTYVLYEKHGDTAQLQVKKIPRYHQYRDAKRLVHFLTLAEAENAASYTKQVNKALVWHVQGSGKSLTMVYCASEVLEAFPERKTAILLDRIQLRQQMKANLATHAPLIVGCSFEPKTTLEFQEHLITGQEKLLIANIQKLSSSFNKKLDISLEESGNSRDKFVILVDEAHRSQSGNFHTWLQKAFEGSTFIGFTGTPASNGKKLSTFDIFGRHILGVYSPAQGLRDKIIVPVVISAHGEKYVFDEKQLLSRVHSAGFFSAVSSTVVDNALIAGLHAFHEFRFLDKDEEKEQSYLYGALEAFKLTLKDILIEHWKTSYRKDAAQKDAILFGLRALMAYISKQLRNPDQERLRQVAKHAVSILYRQHASIPAKALFVASSRETAVRYGAALLDELKLQYPLTTIDQRESLQLTETCQTLNFASSVMVNISGTEEFIDRADTDCRLLVPTNEQEEKFVEDFKCSDRNLDKTIAGKIRIMVVAQKLLTGFDSPSLENLFLDRTLTGNTLLQAVSRTNRTFPGKSFGQIFDFQGINVSFLETFFSGDTENSVLKEAFKSKTQLIEEINEMLLDIKKNVPLASLDLLYTGTSDLFKEPADGRKFEQLHTTLDFEKKEQLSRSAAKITTLLQYDSVGLIDGVAKMLQDDLNLVLNKDLGHITHGKMAEYLSRKLLDSYTLEKKLKIPDYNPGDLKIELLIQFKNRTVVGDLTSKKTQTTEITFDKTEVLESLLSAVQLNGELGVKFRTRLACVVDSLTTPLPSEKTLKKRIRRTDEGIWDLIELLRDKLHLSSMTETLRWLMEVQFNC
jgi:type I site-specific restriction-modification system R (restriction) subunit